MSDLTVALAAVIGAHGVTGEVRLKLFGDDPGSLKAFGRFEAAGRSLTMTAIRPGPNGAVARFAEIGDRTAAERLRGVELTVLRSELPALAAGEYYHCDLIGLRCDIRGGSPVGMVVAVENFGAGDIVEIERTGGKHVMVPIHAVEIEPDHIVVDPLFLD